MIAFATARDPDAVLMECLSAERLRRAPGPAVRAPGEPVRVLLAGYFGARNTGSDMRSSEIVRHMRRLLGAENVLFTALSLTDDLPPQLFPDVRAAPLTGFYPDVVAAEIGRCHAVIACEGSTFKSTFSEVLTALMAGTLGAAARAGQPALAYGAEVGSLTPRLEAYVRANAHGATIMARNPASKQRADALGLRALLGADTAWTFTPSSDATARRCLADAGWNGHDPIIAFCPVNPFWWPVRAEPATFATMQRTNAARERHYGAVFFHTDSTAERTRYRVFIAHLARALTELCARRGAFPVIVGMDRVDAAACADLAAALPVAAAVMNSGQYPAGDLIAVLRQADLLVSGRFHALVGAMPAAVPAIALAFDERVGNLLGGSGAGRVISVEAPDLGQEIVTAADALDRAACRRAARRLVAGELAGMARMAAALREEFAAFAPDLAFPDANPIGPLPIDLRTLLEEDVR